MKTKIVGWMYIIGSAFFIFWGLISFLTINDTFGNPSKSLIVGFLELGIGIYAFFLGSAVKSHKKWSYKAGLITFSLVGLGNLIPAFLGNFYTLIPVLFNAFCIYALINEKNLFANSVTQS